MNGVGGRGIAVVGAGISGLHMSRLLEEAGYCPTIFEKADEVGGTWRENTYPGLVCDVPASVYTYSWARKPDWPRWLASGAEIQDYVKAQWLASGLRERIVFGSEVVEARWDDGHWMLRTTDGAMHDFDAVIFATGFLHRPRYPDIPGLELFSGALFHSARWDHRARVEGRRVGVVGTGSTGVQIVTALVGVAERVLLFQRTAQWIFPMGNPRIPAPLRKTLSRWPRLSELWVGLLVRAIGDLFLGPAANRPGLQRRLFGWACRRNLLRVRDPDLRARLTPTDEPLCKRPVMSTAFYNAIQCDDVELVDAGIERVCAEGVITRDGRLHPLDVIVLATGFDAHAYLRPVHVVGEHGITLDGAWQGGPFAYSTVALPGFPNLFLLLGPHSPLINVPIHESVELQASYVMQLLCHLRRSGCGWLAPSAAAMARWRSELRRGMAPTVWANGCQSWYIGPDGIAIQWPFSRKRLRTILAWPDLRDYKLGGPPQPVGAPAAVEAGSGA
jgi:cation diffusion facilitator CzcD-associated flavoprotein CzcO